MTKASEWASRVAAWRASGQSASEYCAGREYSGKTLQWWSSRLRRKSVPGASRPSAEPVRLARVVGSTTSFGRAGSPTGVVVVQVGAVRVEVSHGTDRSTLTTVLEALGVCGAGSGR